MAILTALSQSSGLQPQQTRENLVVLLGQVAAQDRGAFSELYQSTSLKLFGVVLRILRQRSLAEDILQEVYVKIWERAGDFNASRGSPITWMVAIARNRALDEVRRKSDIVSSEDVAEFDNIGSGEPHALDQLEDREQYQRLARCLGGIDDEKRRMLLLAYHYGLSRENLAAKFGQPVSTVKTWLRRSLQSLKECLES